MRGIKASNSFPNYTQSSTPSSPTSGEFWWDTSIHVLKRYNGTSWDWVGLDDLANVDTSAKSDTDIVEWDNTNSQWVDATKPSGGGGGGALTLVDDQVLASAAANITFSSIPGTYTDLMLIWQLRADGSGLNADILVHVGNGSVDTGSNYRQFLNWFGSSSGNQVSSGRSGWLFAPAVPGDTADSGVRGVAELKIMRYAETGENRSLHGSGGSYHAAASATWGWNMNMGEWSNTADAIDTIRITTTDVDLAAGSRAVLYGLG